MSCTGPLQKKTNIVTLADGRIEKSPRLNDKSKTLAQLSPCKFWGPQLGRKRSEKTVGHRLILCHLDLVNPERKQVSLKFDQVCINQRTHSCTTLEGKQREPRDACVYQRHEVKERCGIIFRPADHLLYKYKCQMSNV